jgi:hypothetical protein
VFSDDKALVDSIVMTPSQISAGIQARSMVGREAG